ncbi:MAG: LarC family nickel insertion protein [Desulfovibrio sp.]|nr:LarC family nickel insertion protein [Desulfovibrio sp.]
MKKEMIIQLETNLDHLSGEETGAAIRALSGLDCVLDVIYLSGIGKKNRPSGLLRVLCAPPDEERTTLAVFRHTHTLGIRIQKIERVILSRRESAVSINGEIVRAKEYELEGEAFVRPEADEVDKLATDRGVGSPAFRFARDGKA